MPTIRVVHRTIDHLHRPFVQRLIMLVVSTFLAMSLGYATSVIAPKSGSELLGTQPIGLTSLHCSFRGGSYTELPTACLWERAGL